MTRGFWIPVWGLGFVAFCINSATTTFAQNEANYIPSPEAVRSRIGFSYAELFNIPATEFVKEFLELLYSKGLMLDGAVEDRFWSAIKAIKKNPDPRLTEASYEEITEIHVLENLKSFKRYPSEIETFIRGATQMLKEDDLFAESSRSQHFIERLALKFPGFEGEDERFRENKIEQRRLNLLRTLDDRHYYTLKVLGNLVAKYSKYIFNEPESVDWLQQPIESRDGFEEGSYLWGFEGVSRQIREKMLNINHDEGRLADPQVFAEFAKSKIYDMLGGRDFKGFLKIRTAIQQLFSSFEFDSRSRLDILYLYYYLDENGMLESKEELEPYFDAAAALLKSDPKSVYSRALQAETPIVYNYLIESRYEKILSEEETEKYLDVVDLMVKLGDSVNPFRLSDTSKLKFLPQETLGYKIQYHFLWDGKSCNEKF